MQFDPIKGAQALDLWKELQEFLSIVRGRLLLTTFYAAERRRVENDRVWQDTFTVFYAGSELFRENFLARSFTETELEDSLFHILSIADDDPLCQERKDVYIHVGASRTVRVIEDTLTGPLERQISESEREFIQWIIKASAIPMTILRLYSSAYEFFDYVRMASRQPLDSSALGRADETGWLLYNGGLGHFVDSLKALLTHSFQTSDQIHTASPILHFADRLQMLLPPTEEH